MEKLVFLFRRKDGLSREAFQRHYVEKHSPLGLRVMKGLSGYTVNHLVTDAQFDTITEIWSPSALGFAGGSTVPDPEILADHVSFMGPQDSYVVEERILRDGPLDGALGQPGTRRKVISLHARDEQLPALAEDAVRVVDNVVREQVYAHDRRVEPGFTPALAVIRTSWFEDSDIGREPAPSGLAAREYRYRAAEAAAVPG